MSIESERDLTALAKVGRIVALRLAAMKDGLRPGMTTAELDAVGEAVLREHGAFSAPRQHYGFPGANWVSINDETVHGIPTARTIQAGDLATLRAHGGHYQRSPPRAHDCLMGVSAPMARGMWPAADLSPTNAPLGRGDELSSAH